MGIVDTLRDGRKAVRAVTGAIRDGTRTFRQGTRNIRRGQEEWSVRHDANVARQEKNIARSKAQEERNYGKEIGYRNQSEQNLYELERNNAYRDVDRRFIPRETGVYESRRDAELREQEQRFAPRRSAPHRYGEPQSSVDPGRYERSGADNAFAYHTPQGGSQPRDAASESGGHGHSGNRQQRRFPPGTPEGQFETHLRNLSAANPKHFGSAYAALETGVTTERVMAGVTGVLMSGYKGKRSELNGNLGAINNALAKVENEYAKEKFVTELGERDPKSAKYINAAKNEHERDERIKAKAKEWSAQNKWGELAGNNRPLVIFAAIVMSAFTGQPVSNFLPAKDPQQVAQNQADQAISPDAKGQVAGGDSVAMGNGSPPNANHGQARSKS